MLYAPLRVELKSFLHDLRANLSASADSALLSGSEWSEVVDDLIRNDTFVHADWVGCQGSLPRYRGYPCSLWQLFHSMTVGAMLSDPSSPGYVLGHPG